MKPIKYSTCVTSLIAIAAIWCPDRSNAAVMLTPDAIVSVSGGEFNPTFAVSNLINGSVSATFTSGITNFDTYITTSSSATDTGTPWSAAAGNSTATIVFDLGEEYELKAMAIWNSPLGSFPGPGQGTNAITVEIDDNSDFSSPLEVGSANLLAHSQLQIAGGFANVFDPGAKVITRYVRLNINSTSSGSSPASLGEVAFGVNPVPEPSSTILLGFGCLSLAFRRSRH